MAFRNVLTILSKPIAKSKGQVAVGLFLTLLVASFLRFYKLSSYPVSLSMDEVAIGYNAYSILKTGRDEWGKRFPLAFKSVGDYKPPVDIYLTVPSIALFGLSEFAVRFPVALLGALTSIVFVFILRELKFSWWPAILGGFWLAISPWHIHFSRASFEAITALFFLLLGLLCFLFWIRKQYLGVFLASLVSFSLSVWAYHSSRFFVPVLSLFLLFLFKKTVLSRFFNDRKFALLSLLVIGIFATPFLRLAIFTPAIRTRAEATSILREPNLALILHRGVYRNLNELIFDNDIYLVFNHWLGKYLNYFDFRFWFWKGMRFTPPEYLGLGLLYMADFPIFLLGIYALYFSKNKVLKRLSVFWFFAGPLAASFTMNEQHPLRALVWLPFFGLIWASGVDFLWCLLKRLKREVKYFLLLTYFALFLWNIFLFINIYFFQFPRFYSEYWQYGYKQNALYACKNRNKYRKIYLTDTFGSFGPLNTGTPYLYILFYCQYSPKVYAKDGYPKGRIANIYTKRPDWKNDSKEKNILMIGSPWDLPIEKIPPRNIIKQTFFLNGKPAFYYVKSLK